MKLISWNVNSLKARLEHVKAYLSEQKPDALMLQEIKGLEFPEMDFTALGYHAATALQKTYNGVAILSKTPITVFHKALPGMENDEQARYLEVDINGLRVINVYCPNGNPVDSEKYPYKLRWMDALKARLKVLRDEHLPFVIGGDFNIIPEDKDCYSPAAWKDDALFKIESRAKLRALLNLGLTDAFRVFDSSPERYTFWDYQAGAWPKNHGIRIDHFLLSPEAADRLEDCRIDTAPRGLDKPSDHTPVIVQIAA
ncbi:MAG: exodeoxyribonuclease III [Alphaproteobacteria bacterium]|nr:exodeoxyribonuclease III [Alphaproteobacteria bacterium]